MVPLDFNVHLIVLVLLATLCVAVHDKMSPIVPWLDVVYLFVLMLPLNAIVSKTSLYTIATNASP